MLNSATMEPIAYSNFPVTEPMTKTMNRFPPSSKDDSILSFNKNEFGGDFTVSRKRPRQLLNRNGGLNSGDLLSVTNFFPGKNSCGPVAGDGRCFSFLGEDMSVPIIQQQFELDRLICLHMEKMKEEIQQSTRIHSNITIRALEGAILKKLQHKDEQIDRITKLNEALQERIKSLYLENQLWRELAQSNEATANALRLNLQQILAQIKSDDVQVIGNDDDAESSCCGSSASATEDAFDEFDGDRILKWRKVAGTRNTSSESRRMCRRCGRVESSVLVLPCRHLCLCAECAPTVDICPVCNSSKNATVHVNFS